MKSYQRLLFVITLISSVAISSGSALSESLAFDEIIYRDVVGESFLIFR